MDETFDFVIVGSGAGSMAAALLMRSLGKSVLVLEKLDKVGGTTATSGGVMWIPNNRLMKTEDSREKAIAYLDALAEGEEAAAPAATRERRLAFVEEGPKMVDFLVSQGIKLRWIPSYPDYYSGKPGALDTSRTITSELFDMSKLGAWKSKFPPSFLPLPVTIDEAQNLPWMKQSKEAKKVVGKIAFRTLLGKLTGKQLLGGGQGLQAQMVNVALKTGVEIRLNAAVRQIVAEGGRVTGVAAEIDGRERRIGATSGVLLAAGGFSRNQAMRDEHIPGTSTNWTNTGAGDTGEVMQEAMRLGAAVAQMGEMVGQPVALPPGRPASLVHGDVTKPHSLIVDHGGERFMNEAQSYVELGRGLLEHRKVSPAAWLVVDSAYLKKYMFVGTMAGAAKPQAWIDQGFLKKGDTLDELAAVCGIPADKLRATVERFNGFAGNGRDEDFHRGERAYDRWLGDPFETAVGQSLGTVAEGPFYAIQLYPGDVSTFGGLVTDAQARVLRADGSVIEGLYATGTTTASALGRRSPGAGASIGPAFTFAYIAAKHAAHAGNLAQAAA
jgi:3-oxosteroid 1-dehydrogenase